MCITSMIHDHYRPYPDDWWTTDKFNVYKTNIRKAEELDKLLGSPDCGVEAKKELVKKIAEKLGLNPDEVFSDKRKR